MNRNCLLLMQYIMFCALWVKSASLVHLERFEAVFEPFGLFFVIYFTTYYRYIYEEVNIYEEHVDSMRHFALL